MARHSAQSAGHMTDKTVSHGEWQFLMQPTKGRHTTCKALDILVRAFTERAASMLELEPYTYEIVYRHED